MSKVKIWLEAFRLRTLPLSLSGIVVASFVATANHEFNLWVFIFAMLTTLFLQILSNLANDYGDTQNGADTDDRIGPKRVTQSGDVTKTEMKLMIGIFVALSLVSGIALIYFGVANFALGITFFVIGISAIAAAIKYTAGKNPYGYRGMGDVFVFVFFGLVSVLGTYFLHAAQITWSLLLPAATIGFFSTAVLNLNNMRDRVSDEKAGKRSLVVMLGIERAKIYHTSIVTIGMLLPMLYTWMHLQTPWQWIFMSSYPMLLLNLKAVAKHEKPESLDPELKKVALSTLFFAVTFGLGLLM